MMQHLLLHLQTAIDLERFSTSGNHAVILRGSIGAGLSTIARALAEKLLATDNLENAPHFSFIQPANKSITIEQVRELQATLVLRTTGKQAIRRVIILHKADTMTEEAQNALLKSLEEPPLDTVFVLTSYQPQTITATIQSRVQSVLVRRVAIENANAYFGPRYSPAQVARAHALSDGQVGLMAALLEDAENHEVASAINTAKELYGMELHDRLVQVERISKDKDILPQLVFACKRICIGALESAASKGQHAATASWTRKLSVILDAEAQLRFNPNPKLFVTNLFMQM